MNSPDVNAMIRLYTPQVGSGHDDGLTFYRSNYRRQRGAGLGSIFGSIARRLIPFARNFLLPAAEKYVLPHAKEAVKNIAGDILSGKNVKQSFKEHGKTAIKGIGNKILSQSGSGRKRKRNLSKRRSSKKIKRSHQKSGPLNISYLY
jgi:hypothetical protein